MATKAIGTPEQLRDPNYTPPMHQAIPLGIQHVLAMFVANVTPAIIIAGAAGFGYGSNSPDFPQMIYLIQISMFFAGITTLIQTIGIGPVGARLPVVMGTSFAFIPVMVPIVAGKGVDAMAALTGGVMIGGMFHAILGLFIGRIRFALPPLVTGLVVLLIGLSLVRVGIQYAAGGVAAIGTPEYGSLQNWTVAVIVVLSTLFFKFFVSGIMSISAILVGLLIGYLVALPLGMVDFNSVATAAVFSIPDPLHFGVEFSAGAIIGISLMAFVSAVETVGDVTGILKAGAGRDATDDEIRGATFADGLGTAFAGLFGSLPNTSFSQNVGLIAMTGVMSRHVVTIGAVFLILCGLFPKLGAIISTVPIEVLGGSVIVMFGMIAAAGVSILSDVDWNRRNMVIFGLALSLGLGLQLEPAALAKLPTTIQVLLTSGLLPAALIAIVMNLLVPHELRDEATEEISGGMAGKRVKN
ncbi:nucleobase:cation symporter-2, NCS2 family [Paracoccus halophilus]|uniref:Nucleobase:cation symporter-2, NCS2 family n=1 Tax=Paracoccus halophilus TaxID=376733 RepID=A0A099F6D1_9RHOB|nr:nucleobase:cation symporter-2 family protein [Paracoccus halophilus]KGJ05989.1 uracil permease [Paracoccus halophilus]SFA54044.1 nucleobase:cation symporter-2, NCS2 family [Paracoccus halophilus]